MKRTAASRARGSLCLQRRHRGNQFVRATMSSTSTWTRVGVQAAAIVEQLAEQRGTTPKRQEYTKNPAIHENGSPEGTTSPEDIALAREIEGFLFADLTGIEKMILVGIALNGGTIPSRQELMRIASVRNPKTIEAALHMLAKHGRISGGAHGPR